MCECLSKLMESQSRMFGAFFLALSYYFERDSLTEQFGVADRLVSKLSGLARLVSKLSGLRISLWVARRAMHSSLCGCRGFELMPCAYRARGSYSLNHLPSPLIFFFGCEFHQWTLAIWNKKFYLSLKQSPVTETRLKSSKMCV